MASQRGRVLVLVDGVDSVAALARLLNDLGYDDTEVSQLFDLLGLGGGDDFALSA